MISVLKVFFSLLVLTSVPKHKTRLGAFSVGDVATINITMVLELKNPYKTGWESLKPEVTGFISYVFSCICLGIYRHNH